MLQKLTQTSIKMFLQCPYRFYLRYRKQIVPNWYRERMYLGDCFHRLLANHYKGKDCFDFAKEKYVEAPDREQAIPWLHALAIIEGYKQHYLLEDDIKPLHIEKLLESGIYNPKTDCPSWKYSLAGKVDIIAMNGAGECILVEHKLMSAVQDNLLMQLWSDFQLITYANLINHNTHYQISKVVYNIVVRSLIKQGKGETNDEFILRRAALMVKNKSGKSNAKKKEEESCEDYYERLVEQYQNPVRFKRFEVNLEPNALLKYKQDIWDIIQWMNLCDRNSSWRQNRCHCESKYGLCEYYDLCSSDMSDLVLEHQYKYEGINKELEENEKTEQITIPF